MKGGNRADSPEMLDTMILIRVKKSDHEMLMRMAKDTRQTMARYIREKLGLPHSENRGGSRQCAGRPSGSLLLTAVADRILKSLRDGNDFGVAAAEAGITRGCLWHWRARGRVEPSGQFHEFSQLVDQAIVEREART